jgi:hypothetical protein
MEMNTSTRSTLGLIGALISGGAVASVLGGGVGQLRCLRGRGQRGGLADRGPNLFPDAPLMGARTLGGARGVEG